jgi:DHA1 family inner membrane transport protein
VSVIVLTFVNGLFAIALVSVVIGYVIHSLFPAMDTYMLSALPDHHRASAYALFSASMMLVQAFGSGTVGTAVSRGAGYDATFRVLSLAVVAMVGFMFVLYRLGWLPSGGTPGETPTQTPP